MVEEFSGSCVEVGFRETHGKTPRHFGASVREPRRPGSSAVRLGECRASAARGAGHPARSPSSPPQAGWGGGGGGFALGWLGFSQRLGCGGFQVAGFCMF